MFKIEFKGFNKDNLELSLLIPLSLLHQFTDLFHNLKQVFEYSSRQAVINNAYNSNNDYSFPSSGPKTSPFADDKFVKDFEVQILKNFDDCISRGLSLKIAISETNKVMKGHCWGHYQAVFDVIKKYRHLKAYKDGKGKGQVMKFKGVF